MRRRSRIEVKETKLDRAIGSLFPGWAMRRARARFELAAFNKSYKATDGGRSNRQRNLKGGSGDDVLFGRHGEHWKTLFELREIAWDLDRNNGLASSMLDRVVENVVGPAGFELQPRIGYVSRKGRTAEEAAEEMPAGLRDVNRQIAEDWCEFLERGFDYRRDLHGWEVLRKCYRGELAGGDHWLQRVGAERLDASFIGLEPDRVLTPVGGGVAKINGMRIVNGVARNSKGRKQYLWVCDHHPQNGIARKNEGRALAAGRFIQFYDPRRLSSSRGLPVVTPVIADFDDIDDLLVFNKAGLKLVAASGLFVESDNPAATQSAMMGLSDGDDGSRPYVSGGDEVDLFDPEAVHFLRRGEKAGVVESNRPGNGFGPFFELLNRFVGLPLGLPYELTTLNFSKVNFASSRQLLNQAIRRFRKEQVRLGWRVSDAYRFWLEVRIAAGFYSVIAERPDRFRHLWGVPGWPSPNPLQDANAARIAIENGFGSRTGAARNNGDQIDQIFSELVDEETRIEGSNLSVMPMAKLNAGG